MASSIIHIAVANEINKVLKRDKTKILIGSIAPDISKIVGENRDISHFIEDGTVVPNMKNFLKKYYNYLYDDFVMGYYIHLYTDYLWSKYFLTEILHDNTIQKKDGTSVKICGNMAKFYIYNDYTNLNIQLIEKYHLDLEIFYEPLPKLKNIITEISMNKLNLLLDKAEIIIANTKKKKNFVFDIKDVSNFIDISTKLILASLEEITIKH